MDELSDSDQDPETEPNPDPEPASDEPQPEELEPAGSHEAGQEEREAPEVQPPAKETFQSEPRTSIGPENPAQPAPPAATENVVTHPSGQSLDVEDEDLEEKEEAEEVVYEWEEELEHYDEPDIYPSEKDYKWLPELVSDDEEEEIVAVPAATEEEAKLEEVAVTAIEEAGEKEKEEKKKETEEISEKSGEDLQVERESIRPSVDTISEKEKEGTEEGKDEEEAMSTHEAEAETEQEKEPEAPKKKYKTILVKTLIPRPPKIHYEPDKERTIRFTNDAEFFSEQPFRLCYSFGYDGQRMANLHVLDDKTLVYMSGFVLTFLNHETLEKSYLRCLGGSCFGALAIHPSRKLFAAAEKGKIPQIGIWSWPKLQLFRQLKEGTERIYASVNFSPNGKLLASQGGDPDYLITVWNWLAETPVLRVKSHAQDVYRVTFSKELAGRLTTSGLCHIKFWKMAHTFTGLKLKGDIGRFGKTELSDIEGYVEMPDGKVLSGSEWGNLLVWENGLMVAELCIRSDLPCHDGIVRQVLLHEGEFYTAGQDGYVRTWSFDAVDTAEIHTSEESLKVPLKVIAQSQVAEDADVWSIVQNTPDLSTTSVFWFAQDGKGAIWKVDLSFLNTAKDPFLIMTAHGGPIVGCQFSPTNCLFATLGVDGQMRVYNYITRELVAKCTYSAPGSCLMWPPNIDSYCTTMIAGFADGTVRVIVLSGLPSKTTNNLPMSLNLEGVRKPHGKKLTCMDLNKAGSFLVTGGEDGTIFFFDVEQGFLPMAFVAMPDWKAVRIVKWSRSYENKTVFVALDGGTVQEVQAPKWEEINNETSYHHIDAKLLRRFDFKSIKSELRHNEELERERLDEEARQQLLEEENRQRITDGLETQSEQDLRLLQEAEELERLKLEQAPKKKWEPYIPPEPSPILLLLLSEYDDSEMLLSMGKYDAGYMYVMRLQENEDIAFGDVNPTEPISSIPVVDSDDVPITAAILSNDGSELFMGFEDGRIRVQQLAYSFDLEKMGAHWTEGVHDSVRGSVTAITLEKAGAFMITCGNDGNCFLHSLWPEANIKRYIAKTVLEMVPMVQQRPDIQDIIDADAYTLETFKNIEKEMALLAAAKRNKTAKREEIARLRLAYTDILKRNNELPDSVRLTPVELAIAADAQSRKAEESALALKQLHMEMAWETERCNIGLNKLKTYFKDILDCEYFILKSFNSNVSLCSYRLPNLPPFFEEAKDKIMTQRTPKAVESDIMDDDVSSAASTILDMEPKPKRTRGMDKFVHQRLVRLWKRKQKKIQRRAVWREFLASEPKGRELKEEDRAIDEAHRTMGDMKLKMAPDYKVPDDKKLSEHRARKRLVYLEELMFGLKKEFNAKLLDLRQQKIASIERMKKYLGVIVEKQTILPADEIMPVPRVDAMTLAENPKSYMDYTAEDINVYKQQISEKLKAAAAQVAPVKAKKQEGPVKRKHHGKDILKKASGGSITKFHKVPSDHHHKEEPVDLGSYVEHIICEPSPLELKIRRYNLESARHYQKYYIDKIAEEKFIFDSRLKLLRHRKVKLDYLLKIADERMVILTEEFILAQRSEAMEASMEVKIVEANKHKKECGLQIKALSKKLDAAKKELDGYAKQRSALLQEVMAIGTRAPGFEKYLVRVFQKRISKPKIKAEGGDEESDAGSDSDEQSESSSDMDLDIEDDDDELDVDFPPPELNKEVYEQAIEVRGRRVIIDEQELITKEVYDEVNNNILALKAKSNAADREFESARKELEAFAKEKQQHLNNLDCVVSLKLHQINYSERDLRDVLVTENNTIKRLQQRIPELRKERKLQRKKGLEIKKTFRQLNLEKQKFEERLEEMSKKCDLEMLKKFGVVTTIEELENFTIDPQIVALKQEVAQIENQNLQEILDLETVKDDLLEKRMTEVKRQTARLFTQAEIIKNISYMTHQMDEDMKKLPSEYEDMSTRNEISFLKKLVMEQWKALNALNLELNTITGAQRRHPQPLPPIRPQSEKPPP